MKRKLELYTKRYSDLAGRFSWRKEIYARKVLELLKPQRTDKILEIGCNQGELVAFLRKYSAEVIGCDINKTAISNSKVTGLAVMSADKLQYFANSFDKVISIDVIEHVKNPRKMLSEMQRILKKGGICFLVFPFEFFRGSAAITDSLRIYGNPLLARQLHLNKFSPNKIARLTKMKLIKHGFFCGPFFVAYYTLLKNK